MSSFLFQNKLDNFFKWSIKPWNNGKSGAKLVFTSSTKPGLQIHKFDHTRTANPCDWLPCRCAALPLVGCLSATSPSCWGTHFLYLSNPPSGNLLPIIPWPGRQPQCSDCRPHPAPQLLCLQTGTLSAIKVKISIEHFTWYIQYSLQIIIIRLGSVNVSVVSEVCSVYAIIFPLLREHVERVYSCSVPDG